MDDYLFLDEFYLFFPDNMGILVEAFRGNEKRKPIIPIIKQQDVRKTMYEAKPNAFVFGKVGRGRKC